MNYPLSKANGIAVALFQNKVGRPLLQKLVGANAIAKADSLCFITTSDYTYDAVEYAKEVGMQLYNGETIEHWMRCYFRK